MPTCHGKGVSSTYYKHGIEDYGEVKTNQKEIAVNSINEELTFRTNYLNYKMFFATLKLWLCLHS